MQAGVIFCSISEAVKEYPDLVRKYLGSVVGVPPAAAPAGWTPLLCRRLGGRAAGVRRRRGLGHAARRGPLPACVLLPCRPAPSLLPST